MKPTTHWGPVSLPAFLSEQLGANGFSPDDAGRCARLIREQPSGSAAAASLFVDLGSCKFLEADIDGAIAAWRHGITSNHDAAAARSMLNLGLLYEHLHLHDRALGLFTSVAERNVAPHVIPAAMASARCQVAVGDGERAMETMARLAQRVMAAGTEGADLSEALYGLGDIAEHAGRADRAERAWRAVLAGGKSDVRQAATERLVRLLLSRGQDHAVLELLSTGTYAADDTDPVLLDAAELLLQRDERDLAADVLAMVKGDHCEAGDRFRLADAKMRCGHVNEAIDELEALLAYPDEQVKLRSLFSLGQVYAAHDMADPAMSMFQRVVASADDYWGPVGALALGDLVAIEDDREAASKHWAYAAGGRVPSVSDQAQERLAGQSETVRSQQSPSWSSDVVPEIAAAAGVPPASSAPVEPPVVSLDTDDKLLDMTLPAATGPSPVATDVQEVSLVPTDHEVQSGDSDTARVDEPVVVMLETLEPGIDNDGVDVEVSLGDPLVANVNPPIAASVFVERSATSAFVSRLDDVNPYAALAPDHDTNDVAPSTRNPYEELAPNFDDVEFELPPDVEPGDWESMIQDRPLDEPDSKPKSSSSAFSRYT